MCSAYLANLIDFLLSPQTLLVLHLIQPPLLEGVVSSLESSFRMAINLVGIVRSDIQSIERIVNSRCVKRRSLLRGRRLIVEAGKVETARLLHSSLLISLGFARQRGLFFLQQRLLFCLFTCGFCLFGGSCFTRKGFVSARAATSLVMRSCVRFAAVLGAL